ncbi:hypothetical protein [Brachyspira hampsonii]|uniref:Late embryogenesis abundant protein LEA-2 subgroup domain-containing protein n=1 Tax=Brachyspira hampsonii TaxID=1287055 RepID=A0AAC9TQP9_9SPIR|nr:hypothetical protein [Brachyspira hampsonii]ASJ21230.1 hypothetical protein BHAMNSH16_06005 [Brachyspira hampsonii]ELV05861.1 hypothetical protein H263_07718 [Brachyspira hampsonii 30599]MBW5379491.1 hypothetical protein [Brachyspira hampsonii]MBW5410423.1 hypothetical protein [Brachyspira hampsonii]OEJ17577.1 hypothetical protein A9496_10970 [Brachyspira hampsonii]
MKLIKILIFLLIITVVSCSKVKSEADKITREYIEKYKPDITIKSASIYNITLSDITLNTLLEIKNNLPFELPIEKLEINLINSSGDIFANSKSSEESNIIKIPANDSREINMKSKAKYIDLFQTALDAIRAESLKCNADIIITFNVYGMNFQFKYNVEINFIK